MKKMTRDQGLQQKAGPQCPCQKVILLTSHSSLHALCPMFTPWNFYPVKSAAGGHFTGPRSGPLTGDSTGALFSMLYALCSLLRASFQSSTINPKSVSLFSLSSISNETERSPEDGVGITKNYPSFGIHKIEIVY